MDSTMTQHQAAELFATPENPIPGGPDQADPIVGFFTGHRKVKLRYAIFKSADPAPKGTVVLLQGRNECIEKYFETIRDLTSRGLWVATFDLRGQGGSDRLRKRAYPGHVRRFSDYERDLELFLDGVVLPDCRLPFFLLAHSTGGLIALSAAPRLANRIDRMVLTAPFVGLAGLPVPESAVRLLARLLCLVGLGGITVTADHSLDPFEVNDVSSDPRRYGRNQAIVKAHPQLIVGPPTARWLLECLRTIVRVRRPDHLYSITVPTVLIAPVRDQIVPYAAQEFIAQYFRAAQLVPVAGSQHEILQDQDRYRAQAIAAIDAFIPGTAQV